MFYKIGSKKSAEKLKKYLDNHKHHNFIFEIIGECEVFSLFFTENFSKVLEELEHVRNIDEIIDVEILQIQSQEPTPWLSYIWMWESRQCGNSNQRRKTQ